LKYLLDTCLISELVRPKPDPQVTAWVSACDEDQLYLSVLTLGEIQKGISKLQDVTRKDKLQHWLDRDLMSRFRNRILNICENVSLTWGVIQGEAESKGIVISSIDGLIGATGVAHNLTVATRNEKDILPTGVNIINPWHI